MFASDNCAHVHPRILEAIARANSGEAASYGADAITQRVEAAFAEIFERDCAVLLVPTGTAANALALAACCPPWGAIFCHRHAHVIEDEGGAPEFFTGGAKLLALDGAHGKLSAADIAREAAARPRAWVHGAHPFAVTITQASESGTVYSADEIAAIGETCRAHGLKLHMDGARFANAVASLKTSPAALTWQAGVDILSFGATKGGAMAAEAIVCFDEALAPALPHLRKRAGSLLSKHRYIAAQMEAFLADGLWLDLAAHANGMAQRLAAGLRAAGAELLHPVEANAVFVRLSARQAEALRAAGVNILDWPPDGPGASRLVASWVSAEEDLARVLAALEAQQPGP